MPKTAAQFRLTEVQSRVACAKSQQRRAIRAVFPGSWDPREDSQRGSIIVFRDADGNIVMILYIGRDGYESGYGTMLARAWARVP